MYKFLHNFSQISGKELTDEVNLGINEPLNPLANETEGQTSGPGPDMSNEENRELFVDWNSDAYLNRDY